MREILVSVICNTYNHGRYIRKALEGFVMQKTSFDFQVLIHDDASTDNTQEIIREFEEKYPEIIKPIYQTENQHSKGVKLSTFQYPRLQGKYVAVCEGDDYWTDEFKLQKQFDALESHPEVDICAHKNACVNDAGEECENVIPQHTEGLIPACEVIMGEGNFVATNTLFYRRSLNESVPEFRAKFNIDYALQIHGSLRGGMLYLEDMMSVYRVCSAGSWTSRVTKNVDKVKELERKKNEMFLRLDKYTDYKYTDVIKERMRINEFNVLLFCEEYKKVLDKRFRDLFKKRSFKNRLKIRIKAYFPFLYRIKRKIKAKG